MDNLKKYAININEKIKEKKVDPIIGRETQILAVMRILTRKTKNNPILIGQPGVGKTAIIEGLAQRIESGDVPNNLKNKQVYSLDLGLLIAGAKFQGEFEERLKAVIEDVTNNSDKVLLFIDEIHMLIGAGRTSGAMDAANLLKPALSRGELNCIGATTLTEYKMNIEKDSAFERRFQKVLVQEPTKEETLNILRGLKSRFEAYHGVKITDEALSEAVNLSTRYIQDRFLPDKAIDLIDEACALINVQLNSVPEVVSDLQKQLTELKITEKSQARDSSKEQKAKLKADIKNLEKTLQEYQEKWNVEKEKLQQLQTSKQKLNDLKLQCELAKNALDYERAAKLEYSLIPQMKEQIAELEKQVGGENQLVNEIVSETNIYSIISRLTNIPLEKLKESDKEKVLQLESNLSKRVLAQPEAVKVVADAILRSKSMLNDPNRPISSFLFIGPTGVGKTEIAKTLAYELFDDESRMIRIDMSEYMESHSVAKIIGAPPGYVGFEQGGMLTEYIKNHPYSIILFDEIEKAHPDVLNILLQILDEGHLTDNIGNKINFKNTIIIMTSNIGSHKILENPQIKYEELQVELLKYIKPELINRIDSIVKFNGLTIDDAKLIIEKFLKELAQRLSEQKVEIKYTDQLLTYIANKVDITYLGARPVKRLIQQEIETELAKILLQTDAKKITIDATDKIEFIF